MDKFQAKVKYLLDNTIFVLTVLLLTALFFSYLLCGSFQKKDTAKKEIIGYIKRKSKTIKRKSSSGVVWYDLEKKEVLSNRDTILSEKLSNAVVVLKDGTELFIGENSMVILDYSGKNMKVNLIKGNIRAKRSKKDPPLVILAGSKKVQLDEGNLNLNFLDEKLDIDVFSGEAVLADESGLLEMFAPDRYSGGNGEKGQIKRSSFVQISPEPHSVHYGEKKLTGIKFSWKGKQQSRARVQVSKDRNFTKVLQTKTTRKKSLELFFPKGEYYWRLLDQKGEKSIVLKFSIIKVPKLQILSPRDGQQIDSFYGKKKVIFEWKRNEMAKYYVLALQQNDKILKKNVYHNRIEQELPLGKYRFSVSTVYKNPEIQTSTTDTFSFVIRKTDSFEPPRLKYPKKAQEVYAKKGKDNHVFFYWLPDATANSYQIEVFKASFSQALLNKRVEQNHFEYNFKDQRGRIVWRVRGIAEQGQKSKFSQSYSFSIAEQKQVDKNLQLLLPVEGYIHDLNKDKELTFRWDSVFKGKEHIIVIKGKRERQIATFKNYNRINLNRPDKYTWWIVVKNGEKTLYTSKKRNLRVIRSKGKKPKIAPTFPSNYSQVAYKPGQDFTLTWKSEFNLAGTYYVYIWQDLEKEVVQLKTGTTSDKEFTVVDKSLNYGGNFTWYIEWFPSDKTKKPYRSIKNYFTLIPPPQAPEIKTDKDIYYLDEK
ncbi:MAG: FecR domain-containing protein [Spirochaetota bacterium]